MVTDLETGKPRGFAFVEFENAQDALSAIRNMNEYELNGRKIRVNFSNSSHLETLAGQLGMDMTQKTKTISPIGSTTTTTTTTTSTPGPSSSSLNEVGTQAVANALKALSKGEMYDVIAKLKEIADNDPDEARKIISGHPQLPEAILYLMSQLDMMKTGINTSVLGVVAPPPPPIPGGIPQPPPRMDPRTAAAVAPPIPSDPRDPRNRAADPRASDPRAAVVDPRRQQQPPPPSTAVPPPTKPPVGVPPPPPQQMYRPGMTQPPPVGVPPPPPMGVAGLDPSLVQQVMGLTAAQIAQLPVDKQNSILALRQQIQNGMGRST